jgi:predicted RNase H-like nuclease (RuvC/YqgF family)
LQRELPPVLADEDTFPGLSTLQVAPSRPRSEERFELSCAMLTAPATPQSRHAVIEPITDVQDPRCGMQDPRNDIRALRSRLDREERRVSQLEEELGRAKTQLEKYTTDRNSLQEQQVQVVMKNDRDDIARFKDQVKGLRMLLEDREKDVSILEE